MQEQSDIFVLYFIVLLRDIEISLVLVELRRILSTEFLMFLRLLG